MRPGAAPFRLGLALAASLLAGCVTLPEFRALEREVADLKGGGGVGSPTKDRLAELGAQVAELEEQMARLRGELEEVQHTARRAIEEAEAARKVQAQAAPGARRGAAPPGAAARGELPAPEPGSLSAEVRAYEDAFRLYRSEDFPAAIDRFRAFLQTYPSSGYADNALFWLGECHFKLGDHEQAVLAFDDVVKRYPDGNKVPDALYRQGIALLEIGDRTGQASTYRPAARQIFERLVNEHPSSERVAEARRQLEKLRP